MPDGSFEIDEGDEETIAERVYGQGPVGISFIVEEGFQNYQEGVYLNRNCGDGSKKMNHSMLIIGYGRERGV